jgi:hypothetical protein
MGRLLASLLLVAGVVVGWSARSGEGPESASGPAPSSANKSEQNAKPGASEGLKIHIDPRTGAILKEAAPGTVPLQLTPKLQDALSTSHEGLAEVPNTVPGGGVKVDLRGRFQSPLAATIGADGTLKMHHLREPSEAAGKP